MKQNIIVGIAGIALLFSIIAISAAFVITPDLLISPDTIGEIELKDNSVTSNKIVDGTIENEDINDTGISKISDGAITINDLSSAVINIISGAAEISNNSITSEKITNYTITTVDIANNSITSEKIVDGEVKQSDIDTDAVGTDEIESSAVGTNEIANGAVTYDKMAIKIKCGLALNVIHRSTVNHNLGIVPTSIVATPIYDIAIEDGTAVLHVNIFNITINSFDIGLWIQLEGMPPPTLAKVDGLFWPPEDIYWIAIYSP